MTEADLAAALAATDAGFAAVQTHLTHHDK